MSRTGIVATIGPACETVAQLDALQEAGMTLARLNGSHGDLAWHARAIATVRRMVLPVPILLDIPGRKIRTVLLAHEPCFGVGDGLVLTTDPGHDGTEKVPVNYPHLHEDVAAGSVVHADDGTLRFTVLRVDGADIHCRCETAGQLKSRKGINVPGVRLQTPLVTDRDRAMVAFAKTQGVDFIGISFVESAAHVALIRAETGEGWPRIVAKIENQGGLDNLHEVIGAADGIMIDRGDLAVETSLEHVALFQKRILAAARLQAKPVIVATEMLHTMMMNPFPTKAEIGDITNAILDGASATMLSGETAVGAHPLAAVEVMAKVARAAEAHMMAGQATHEAGASVADGMSEAVAVVCRSLPVSKIVAITRSGFAARRIAAQQLSQPILAVSDDEMAARSFALLPGVSGIWADIAFSQTTTDHIPACLRLLWEQGHLVEDDLIMVVAVSYPADGNLMNLLETHRVSDLVASLGWAPAAAERMVG